MCIRDRFETENFAWISSDIERGLTDQAIVKFATEKEEAERNGSKDDNPNSTQESTFHQEMDLRH